MSSLKESVCMPVAVSTLKVAIPTGNVFTPMQFALGCIHITT